MAEPPKKPDSNEQGKTPEQPFEAMSERAVSDYRSAKRIRSRFDSSYTEEPPVRFDPSYLQSVSGGAGMNKFFWVFLLLSLNLLLLGGAICFMVFKKPHTVAAAPVVVPVMPAAPAAPKPQPAKPIKTDPGETDLSAVLRTVRFDPKTAESLEKSASLAAAEQLYRAGQYANACYMYDQLAARLFGHTPEEQALKDYLNLKMALCLQRTQGGELMSGLFTRVLESPFPAVRALANYHLAFLELHHNQFLSARRHALGALALLKSLDKRMPESMEADCSFLAAEALSLHLLRLFDQPEELPGQSWSAASPIYEVPVTEQGELQAFLLAHFGELSEASLAPKVTRDPQRQDGAQWSAVCRDVPLEEVLWKFTSGASVNLQWADVDSVVRRRPISLYLPSVSGSFLAETAAGSAGLVWRYDGEKAVLYDLERYTDFNLHKSVLTQEAITVWQRFLLKYRNDERTANAHYLLGVFYGLSGQASASMGEYKLLISQYPNHSLAPFALLNSSRLKTDLLDFEGAQADLQELLLQYPRCLVADEATLYLAEAAMAGGDFEQARRMFNKAFQLNLSETIRCRAAFGLGRCLFEMKDYAGAVQWYDKAIRMTTDRSDIRLTPAFRQLGQALIETGEYPKASAALKEALRGELTTEEYVEIVLRLVDAEIRQGHFVQALRIVESIPERSLSQEQSCEVLLAKARLLQEIDLTESAISLLRRRIEYIADDSIRARLTLELANGYARVGDWRIAEKELHEILYDLEDVGDLQQGYCLLAEVQYKQGRADQAREVCMAALEQFPSDSPYRRRIRSLLAKIHEERKEYENAALIYAGCFESPEGGRP